MTKVSVLLVIYQQQYFNLFIFVSPPQKTYELQAPSSICTDLTGEDSTGNGEPRSASQAVQQNSAATSTATAKTTARTTTTTKMTTKTTTTPTTTRTATEEATSSTTMVAQNPQPIPRADEGSAALCVNHSNILIFVTFIAAHMGYYKA